MHQYYLPIIICTQLHALTSIARAPHRIWISLAMCGECDLQFFCCIFFFLVVLLLHLNCFKYDMFRGWWGCCYSTIAFFVILFILLYFFVHRFFGGYYYFICSSELSIALLLTRWKINFYFHFLLFSFNTSFFCIVRFLFILYYFIIIRSLAALFLHVIFFHFKQIKNSLCSVRFIFMMHA